MFQSHAGSIEARHVCAFRKGANEFQSHAGSIEANASVLARDLLLRGFNPTLVRLRPDKALPAVCLEIRFQSHAGSIEAFDSRPGEWPTRGFQSHAGSIEAPH